MKKEDDSNLDAHFPIRTYGKGELAMCYIRGVCQHTAVKQFNEWIRTAPGLEERLLATGMKRGSRHYTPAQVQLIVNVFRGGGARAPSLPLFFLLLSIYRPLFSHNVL